MSSLSSVSTSKVKAFLARLPNRSGDPRRQAFQRLVAQGVLREHENLDLLRLEVPIAFSSEAMREAEAFDPRDEALRAGRRDLRDLALFSVDDQTTTDIDDAFSLTRTDAGPQLGIHITDLSAAVAPGSPLDETARERVSSLYFPETKIPMLPPGRWTGW